MSVIAVFYNFLNKNMNYYRAREEMPGRSPHRRSPPPPPLISRHSPVLRTRGRSPDRRRPASPGPRGRDRREFRNPTIR